MTQPQPIAEGEWADNYDAAHIKAVLSLAEWELMRRTRFGAS